MEKLAEQNPAKYSSTCLAEIANLFHLFSRNFGYYPRFRIILHFALFYAVCQFFQTFYPQSCQIFACRVGLDCQIFPSPIFLISNLLPPPCKRVGCSHGLVGAWKPKGHLSERVLTCGFLEGFRKRHHTTHCPTGWDSCALLLCIYLCSVSAIPLRPAHNERATKPQRTQQAKHSPPRPIFLAGVTAGLWPRRGGEGPGGDVCLPVHLHPPRTAQVRRAAVHRL